MELHLGFPAGPARQGFTFAMPKSNATVTASFQAGAASAEGLPFTDASYGSDPGTAVSRQQMVTVLYRYAGLMGYTVSGTADLASYPDSSSVSGYAQDAMSWSVANGIVAGTASGTLDPAGTATRAQFSVILMRLCEKMA